MTINKAPKMPAWITDPVWRERLSRWLANGIRFFHAYAGWLVSISWWRFAAYALALLIGMGVLQDVFNWQVVEYEERARPMEPPPKPPRPQLPDEETQSEPAEPPEPASSAASPAAPEGVEIRIGKEGVRIGRPGSTEQAAMVDVTPEGVRIRGEGASAPNIDIRIPPEAAARIREEIEQAQREAEAKAREAEAKLNELKEKQQDWERDYARELREWRRSQGETVKRTRIVRFGEVLWNLTLLWVLLSALVKATYKGRQEAEAKAAAAEETAEAEALKRQLVEARLQTMQAQVEPHFLFNTLASIDHLIETDPQRASRMQKNLIALLRASMPTMREAAGQSKLRDLGKELQVVRPYLEILSVRMEERLQWRIEVPEGLHSAEFPPMIIQGLVENAIKHGLEPKPEGGELLVSARVEHGQLVVEVADTGLGFGRAGTAGTGVGLANTRERLQLLYGPQASLTVTENTPSGTVVRIQVPYRSNHAHSQGA